MFWHEYAKIPRHTSQNAITEGDFKCILAHNCEALNSYVLLYIFCVPVYRISCKKKILLHFESVICNLIHRNLGFDQKVSTKNIFLGFYGSVGGSLVGEEFDDLLINQKLQFAGFRFVQCDMC